MAKTVALIGKIGPAFGDGRASHVELESKEVEDGKFLVTAAQTYVTRVANWRNDERHSAIDSAFGFAAA